MDIGSGSMVAVQSKEGPNPRSRSQSQYPSSRLSRRVINHFLKRHNLRPGHLARLLGTTAQLMYRWRNTTHRPSSRFAVRMLELEAISEGLRQNGMGLEHIDAIHWDLDMAVWTPEGARMVARLEAALDMGEEVGGRPAWTLDQIRDLAISLERAESHQEPAFDAFEERPLLEDFDEGDFGLGD